VLRQPVGSAGPETGRDLAALRRVLDVLDGGVGMVLADAPEALPARLATRAPFAAVGDVVAVAVTAPSWRVDAGLRPGERG
jgi:riboflavin biosynthesis pyrimidine reductase